MRKWGIDSMNLFVIGNGESRRDFDLNLLKKDVSIIVGCNAIYRDFKPNILVSVDRNMIVEIRDNCNFLNEVTFMWRKRYIDGIGNNDIIIEYNTHDENESIRRTLIVDDMGWASGPTAILVCLRDLLKNHVKNVYLMGFDLSRLPNDKGNSMYKDTNNYISSKSPGATHSTSVRQLKTIFGMFEKVNFIRVIDNDNFPNEWLRMPNIKNITYEEFKEILNDIEK